MLPKGIMFDLDDTITTFNAVAEPTWKKICKDYANQYSIFDDAENLYKTVRETSNWYWSDKKRHVNGRLDIDNARKKTLEIVFKKMEIEDLSLCYGCSLCVTTCPVSSIELIPR